MQPTLHEGQLPAVRLESEWPWPQMEGRPKDATITIQTETLTREAAADPRTEADLGRVCLMDTMSGQQAMATRGYQ